MYVAVLKMNRDPKVMALMAELTNRLASKRCSVKWYPDLNIKQKFKYNTNIRHQNEMGEDLHLKTAIELLQELEHCGSQLVLMLHKVQDGSRSELLFYDPNIDI